MSEHPKTIGDRSTLAVMLALDAAGFDISIPFGENTRFDLIASDGDQLLRVQCKTGRIVRGAIRFRTASSYAHHRTRKMTYRPYTEDVDAFGVYCPESGHAYLVPIADAYEELLLSASRSGRQTGVRVVTRWEDETRAAPRDSAPPAR